MISKKFIQWLFKGSRSLHKMGLADLPSAKFIAGIAKKRLLKSSPELPMPYLPTKRADLHLYIPYSLISDYQLKNFEPETDSFFNQYLTKGMSVIDVGANIGYYTVLFAKKVGESGKVYAVEPGSDNLAFLRKNIEINDLAQTVKILPCAAGSRQQVRNFFIHKHSTLHSFYSPSETHGYTSTTIEEIPLDTITGEAIDLIKIDVEGGELDVLQGMQHILNSNSSLQLVIEWNPKALQHSGHLPEDLPNYLFALGFNLSIMDGGPLLKTVTDVVATLKAHKLDEKWHANLHAKRPSNH